VTDHELDDDSAALRALSETPQLALALRAHRRWVWIPAVAVMLVTLIPYLWGASLAGARPALGVYSWFTFNTTDHCVYLSWMRQAADGHFFQRNLFTTEPQSGHQFNLLFLALGLISRITHLPTNIVYQIARIALGIAFLRSVWWLLELLVEDARARRAAFWVLCFSAGLGWIPGLWEMGIGPPSGPGPVDTWQPEAVTFLSLYLFPLFLCSLLLMVGVIGWLVVAERTRSLRPAIYAGICGLLLGNIHTYDVITLMAIWGGYLLVRTIFERRFDFGSWGRALIAGALTAVSTGYMAYLLKTEEVFAKRVAVPTLSPPFRMVILGFGLVLVLAVLGAVWKRTNQRPGDSRLLLIVWAVMNIAVGYLPVAFQRKMVMGAHIPLAILAGTALTALLQRAPDRLRPLALAASIALLSITNVRFVLRDMAELPQNPGPVRNYMYAGERAALDWIRDHTPPGVSVQPLPWVTINPQTGQFGFFDNTVACFTPGLTDHPVNAGHWGETPDFGRTMNQWATFVRPDTTAEWRIDLLRRTGVRYVLFTQKHDETGNPDVENGILALFRTNPPACLRRVPEASNPDADVYEVIL
jgi:hypothetical protein